MNVFSKLLLTLTVFTISTTAWARAVAKKDCLVEGTQVCYEEYLQSLVKSDVKKTCTDKGSAQIAQAECNAYNAEQKAKEANKDLAKAQDQLVRDRTVRLERNWTCTGGDLSSKVRIRTAKIRTPTGPTSKEYKTEYQNFVTVDLDCGGLPTSEMFLLHGPQQTLSGALNSQTCKDGSDPLRLDLKMEVGGKFRAPLTPVKVTGSAAGQTYNLTAKSCTYDGGKVEVGFGEAQAVKGESDDTAQWEVIK